MYDGKSCTAHRDSACTSTSTILSRLPSSSMNGISMMAETDTQADSLLLRRLPPELRNDIYIHVFDSCRQTSGTITSWNEHGDHPKVDLLNANNEAPGNALLASCRTIYHEARAIFVDAQRTFWQQTTFTISLIENDGIGAPILVDHPERLRSRKIEQISSVVIEAEKCSNRKMYLKSGAGSELEPGYGIASSYGLSSSWKVRVVSDDEWLTGAITMFFRDASKGTLRSETLDSTKGRLKRIYEEANTKVDWLARQGRETETLEEASEKMHRTQESLVMFEQAMQCMKR